MISDNTSGPRAKRAAPWTADEWLDWSGFSLTLISFGAGFVACWLFVA